MPTMTLLDAIVDALRPDLLQLHGKEPPARVAAVRHASDCRDESDRGRDQGRPRGCRDLCSRRRCLLFDARAPREATRPGGLGKPFDWRLLENLDPGLPFMLFEAASMPANVAEAMRITRAPGVDVSSGVERAPGEKDTDKIRAFIRAARETAKRHGTNRITSPA